MTRLPRLMIAAAHKSSGKTVISSGIAAAMSAQGERVAGFKKGPDYIDPMWMRLATGRPSYNLDFNTMGRDELRALFLRKAAGADIRVIEANKGLFDGICPKGTDSNAEMAKLLKSPVVLVVDCKGMTRGIAPLLLGYLAFDPDVRIEGVILNKTGGARHESKLRQAVETYTGVPVLGAVGYSAALDISERHLGLTTPAELAGNGPFMEGLARRIRQQVDIDHLRGIAGMAPLFGTAPMPARNATGGAGLKIGYARDEAFSFYYADDLEAFAANGATLVPIDMLRDRALPDLDGLFLGGGFPETQIEALAANAEMRESVRMALEAGLPCHAECGGLMYLCRSITWRGETRPMAGFLDADAMMHSRPQGRGIVHFTPTRNALWHPGSGEGRAHEFHYASLENLSAPVFARTITRGHGIDGAHDGLVKKNTQAGFVHLRHAAAMPWVTDFLAFIRMQRKDGQKQSPARKERGRASSGA